MSRDRDQDGMRVMLFLSLLVTAGLVFGAGVMVGVRLSAPVDCRDGGSSAGTDGAFGSDAGRPTPETELVFPEVLEGSKPLEQLGMSTHPDAGTKEPSRPAPTPGPKSEKEVAAGVSAPPGNESAAPVASGPYCLQVAAYREIEPAAQLAAKLRDQGYAPVEVARSEVPAKGIYFRVRLGRFPDAKAAEGTRQQLMQKHALDTLVVRCE